MLWLMKWSFTLVAVAFVTAFLFNIGFLLQRGPDKQWNLLDIGYWTTSSSSSEIPETTPEKITTPTVALPTETTSTKTTPEELKFLYIKNKEGKPVKLIKLIRAKLGILYLAKDGKTLKFLATKTGQVYQIYKTTTTKPG